MGYRATMKIHSSAGIISAGEIVKKLPKKEIDFLMASGAIIDFSPNKTENKADAKGQNQPAQQAQQELTELPITHPDAEPVGGIGENGATDGNIGRSEGKNDQNK